jgi:NTP pyrophosphatase (non-canonical NTP hydrolase)
MEDAPKNNRHNLDPENFQGLQVCLYDWQCYNFGDDQDNDLTLLGICEEAGELCHAQLKLEQNIRGTTREHETEMIDAIGDMMIYSMNFLSGMKEKVASFTGRTDVTVAGEEDQKVVRQAVKAAFRLTGKLVEKPSAKGVRDIMHQLSYLCALKGWDLEKIVRLTWGIVGQRDWKAYPDTGRPPALSAPASDTMAPVTHEGTAAHPVAAPAAAQ